MTSSRDGRPPIVSPVEEYADHQKPHSEENQLESAMADQSEEKTGECDACHRDVREGRELCETCEFVRDDMGLPVLGEAEAPSEAEETEPTVVEQALSEDEVPEWAFTHDPPEEYETTGIWEEDGQQDLFPDIGNSWRREWHGMPDYWHEDQTAFDEVEVRFGEPEEPDDPEDPESWRTPIEPPQEDGGGTAYGRNPNAIKVKFEDEDARRQFADLLDIPVHELKDGIDVPDREEFAEKVGQTVRDSTQSIWYPEAEIRRMSNKEYRVPPAVRTPERNDPKYPIFIPSRGRYDNCYTPDVLDEIGAEYEIVVEPHEVDQYAERFGRERLIVLPEDLPEGLHTTRTWIKRYCIEEYGTRRHWQMDDNIQGFYRYNDNLKTPASDPTVIRCMEDFVDRYENVALAGPRYFMFVTRKSPMPPVTFNTRVYSCTLVNNEIPHEWELKYNDDTDISLRVLKDGWTTLIFNAFLQYKTPTMELSGGLTEDYEAMDDRREFAEMLKEAHPDVTEVTEKFGRVHHHVDYGPFKGNELERRDDVDVEGMPRVDNRGMTLFVDGEPSPERWRQKMTGEAPDA